MIRSAHAHTKEEEVTNHDHDEAGKLEDEEHETHDALVVRQHILYRRLHVDVRCHRTDHENVEYDGYVTEKLLKQAFKPVLCDSEGAKN